MNASTQENRLLSYLSLFSSLGTLLCCALPSALVLLGLGATVVSFLSAAPWLVTLSRNKAWVFTISGLLISGNFFYVYWMAPRLRAQAQVCPPVGVTACGTADRFNRFVLWISTGIYLVGFFVAYVLATLRLRFGAE